MIILAVTRDDDDSPRRVGTRRHSLHEVGRGDFGCSDPLALVVSAGPVTGQWLPKAINQCNQVIDGLMMQADQCSGRAERTPQRAGMQ